MGAEREEGSKWSAGRQSRRAVLREIVHSGPVARSEIARRLDLTSGAVSRIARPLIHAGLVRELPHEQGDTPVGPGRRTLPLDVEPGGGQVIGIGIDPGLQTITLADIKNRTISGLDLKLDTIEDPERVIRRLGRECRRLIGANLNDRNRLLGGLLSVTGQVDSTTGDVLGAPCLGWASFPVRERLGELVDLPITIRSMADTVSNAEMLFGAARGRNDVLVLLCGMEIDSTLILDGRLVQGDRLPAIRIGAREVTRNDGAAATLDHVGGGLGVLCNLHGDDMTPDRARLTRMAQALLAAVERDRAGDSVVGAVMGDSGRKLGRVVVRFASFIRPEVVLIAGPLSMSPSYTAAVAEVVSDGISPHPGIAVANAVMGPGGSRSASCAMAICEFLLERPLDLARLGVRMS